MNSSRSCLSSRRIARSTESRAMPRASDAAHFADWRRCPAWRRASSRNSTMTPWRCRFACKSRVAVCFPSGTPDRSFEDRWPVTLHLRCPGDPLEDSPRPRSRDSGHGAQARHGRARRCTAKSAGAPNSTVVRARLSGSRASAWLDVRSRAGVGALEPGFDPIAQSGDRGSRGLRDAERRGMASQSPPARRCK